MKFGDGGRARFIRVARSHQAAASGKMIWVPWSKIKVRELVRSYEVLARQNRAEETRPCEIIRIIDPAMLHSVLIIDAAITRPM